MSLCHDCTFEVLLRLCSGLLVCTVKEHHASRLCIRVWAIVHGLNDQDYETWMRINKNIPCVSTCQQIDLHGKALVTIEYVQRAPMRIHTALVRFRA